MQNGGGVGVGAGRVCKVNEWPTTDATIIPNPLNIKYRITS